MKLGPRQKALVAALRSGEYKQGKGRLRQHDRFCCLGVSCDIFSKDEEQEEKLNWHPNVDYGLGVYTMDGNVGLLPWHVESYFAFRTPQGKFGEERQDSLAWKNDYGATFEEIADLIEQHAETLFNKSV